MKIRTGFVSNSSVSSFIVKIRDESILSDPENWPLLLSDEKVDSLITHGYRPTDIVSPGTLTELFLRDNNLVFEQQDYPLGMGMTVVCNQDEEILFLLENNIPFKASVYYGTETVIYEAGSNRVAFLTNPGMLADLYDLTPDVVSQIRRNKKLLFKNKQDVIVEYRRTYGDTELEGDET